MTAVRAGSPGTIVLEGGDARVTVVPAHGGRVSALRVGGREWLLAPRSSAAPSAEEMVLAGGGWDECAPAAGGGALPDGVKGQGSRTRVPRGGESRLQRPSVDLQTTSEGHALRMQWRGDALPWTLTRTLVVRRDGVVEAKYEAVALAKQRLPFLWSAHLLLPLSKSTRLRLPDASRFRIAGPEVSDRTPVAVTTPWPRFEWEKQVLDLSAPWTLPKSRIVPGWADLTGGRATVQVQEGELSLAITTDGDGVPFCGVAIDRGGLRHGARGAFARKSPPALALSPSLGAPDRYADAMGDWASVTWLAPNEPRRWSMEFRALR
jgi:galactose mutarotase-like enzyme